MAYLNTEQHIPLERTCDLLEEFYAHRPSEGTIVAVCAEAAHKVEKSNEVVKEHLVEHEGVGHLENIFDNLSHPCLISNDFSRQVPTIPYGRKRTIVT